MLLNHSAGLMGTTGNNAFLLGDNNTGFHDHILGMLKTQTLKHDPGETSIYSNDGFTLAELLIERVSGMSYTEYMELNFYNSLRLDDTKTPQSEFDRKQLAAIYFNGDEMEPENIGMIGSGGIYATMEDLCGFAGIFMADADGGVLSRQSAVEMARSRHKNPLVGEDADTVINYGLGWDCVDTYPFNLYGIRALSKGGGTGRYHTNLTVLPDYNIAAAVSSSGSDSFEQLIAQEIILEVLREEGLIGDDIELELPIYNAVRAHIPEDIKSYAGFYATIYGIVQAEFTDDSLILTPIGVRNERSFEYIYNTDGKFISTGGDYIGAGTLLSAQSGNRGITRLEFTDDKFIVGQTYESVYNLSQTAYAAPFAEKLASNPISGGVAQAWEARNGKDFLLVNERYSSAEYINAALAVINADKRVPGYVGMGVYRGAGKMFKDAKIVDEYTAAAFQSTPTMAGRDTNNIKIEYIDGIETLYINNYMYIDASSIADFYDIGGNVKITSGALWFDADENSSGRALMINAPANGSWFVYDDKMNCVASSLEKYPRPHIILPENGRIAFAGEAGAEFTINVIG
jgi:hypothetical protein